MLDIVLALSTAILLVLGLTVYYSNPKSRTNLSLAAFIFAGLLWVFTNLLANLALTNPALDVLFFNQLTLIGASMLPLTYLLFVHSFLDHKKFTTLRKAVYITPVACLLSTTFTDLNVKEVSGEIIIGPVYYLIVPLFILYFSYGTFLLLKSYKHSEATRRLQLQYIFWGISLSVIPGLLLNAIVPLFGTISTAYFGPSVVIFFAFFTSMAIVKHRLLNIKRAVARSVAYLFSLGFIGLVYGAIIFGVSSLLANNDHFNNAERIFYIIMALISAVLFSPTKRFFDKVTNRIFYRDAYDPQQFLDELNSTVVENIELGILLRHSTRVIQDNVKSQFCFVQVKGTPDAKQRLIGTGELNVSSRDSKILKEELVKTGKKTVITDDLNPNMVKLKEVMSRNNIGLLIRMMPGADMSQEALYYLIVGDKKSGNIYDKQDVRLMEIIADELLIAIQNSLRFEEIQQFNVTLQQKVNDATEKLQRINKKLRDMDETKDEFISMASHQLRTPLTSVKGYLSMVLEGDAGKLKGNQEELLNQAFVSSQRMVYLIADLLNVSRLKTGKFIIEAAPTNLAEVIESEIAQLKEVAKGKKVALTFKKPEKFPKLMLDETKIRQVIMNFADNAIYYTPSGGQIKIELYEDKSNIYFTVKDDGIGIPQSEQTRLFSKFYRASNARKARPDGTGLGLFMAKKVVNAQGGDVLFESKEGKGSTFGFTFKKSKLLPKEAAAGSVTS